MKWYKKLIHTLLYPQTVILVLLLVISTVSLIVVFAGKYEYSAFSYGVYVVSAYTTTITVLKLWNSIAKVKRQLHKNILIHRYMTELDFKAEVSLYVSLSINIFYFVYKAGAGIYYHSIWFGTVAFYYMILSVERFLLLTYVRKRQRSLMQELKKYRFCGYLLLVLTLVLIAMSVHMIHGGKVVLYAGHIIYAAAGFTFYNLITAIVNILKYRKLKNPIYSASKFITLAAALVSMFSLQVSMFAVFGNNDVILQKQMNMWTGFGVFAIIMVIALFMIIYGTFSIQKLSAQNNNSQKE